MSYKIFKMLIALAVVAILLSSCASTDAARTVKYGQKHPNRETRKACKF